MSSKKHLIFDAGPLINFAMNGILPLLRRLKKEFEGDFLITKEVKSEIIDHPSNIKRFELGAFQLKELLDEGIIKHANLTSQEIEQLRVKRDEILSISNNLFKIHKRGIHILDKGEAAAIALADILNKRGEQTALVIDERTARMLIENPENARLILQKKLHAKIQGDRGNYNFLNEFKVIRSSELIYIANKLGLIELKNPKAYEAMLYAIKYKGCSISEEEIKQLIRL
jgi:predicted nucleic acid-binding protein